MTSVVGIQTLILISFFSKTSQEEETRLAWFTGALGVLFFLFMFFWLPRTNKFAARFQRRVERALGVKITYTYRGAWRVEGHFGMSALVGLLHLGFMLIFWFGPFLLIGAALLIYYLLYGFPK